MLNFVYVLFNPYKPSVKFCGTKENNADPDQTPQNEVSDEGLHCLLTESSIRILIKMKKNIQHP